MIKMPFSGAKMWRIIIRSLHYSASCNSILVPSIRTVCILCRNSYLLGVPFGVKKDHVTWAESFLHSWTNIIVRNIFYITIKFHIQKTKSMAFKWRDPVRTKIVIDNKIIEQVNLLKYLGNMIFYEGELDIDNKLNTVLKITGI